jgi:hypothetical protein
MEFIINIARKTQFNMGVNMKIKYYLILLPLIFLISACSSEAVDIKYKVTKTEAIELEETINNYFLNFNDIRHWNPYSTEDFVKRAYSWCTGDYSEEKSLEEMIQEYYEINKSSLKLKVVTINEIHEEDKHNIIIDVIRKWEDGSEDTTAYSILKINDVWKIDNRI